MFKVRAWIRHKALGLILVLEQKLNVPPKQNPIFVEWMGEDVSWRLLAIKDRLGPVLNNPSASQNFDCLEYSEEDDHDHCDICWARIGANGHNGRQTETFYSNTASGDAVQATICPVCFILFEALCKRRLSIQVTNADAIRPYQLKEQHWIDTLQASQQATK